MKACGRFSQCGSHDVCRRCGRSRKAHQRRRQAAATVKPRPHWWGTDVLRRDPVLRLRLRNMLILEKR